MAERYRHGPDVAWVEDGDGVAVLRLDDLLARPLIFSGTAGAIWAELEPGATVDEVVDRLAAAFAAPPDAIRDDVTAFVDQVVGLGVVVPTGGER